MGKERISGYYRANTGMPLPYRRGTYWNAERAPEKLCLKFEGKLWIYERLRGYAEIFAAALRSSSLRLGE